MIRVFNLQVEELPLTDLLNDVEMFIENIEIGCSKEGYTTALVHYTRNKYPNRKSRKTRLIQRFELSEGENERLNHLLSSDGVRVHEEFVFITEIGTIVVLDYEMKLS